MSGAARQHLDLLNWCCTSVSYWGAGREEQLVGGDINFGGCGGA